MKSSSALLWLTAIGAGIVGAITWWKPKTTIPIKNIVKEVSPPTPTPQIPPIDPQVVPFCKLQPSDWIEVDNWTKAALGATLPIEQRLTLMRSIQPIEQWPASAQRAWCAIVKTAEDKVGVKL